MNNLSRIKILFIVLIIALTGLVYELLAGTISSYLLGDSITSFSITIGFFLFGMGIGSFLSKNIEKRLFKFLINLEIFIALLGGMLPLLAFFSFSYSPFYKEILLLLILLIGTAIGLEIPLIIRLVSKEEGIRVSVANIFGADYLGALLGSLLFPMLLLPLLGIYNTTILMSFLNLGVSAVLIYYYNQGERKYSWLPWSLAVFFLFVLGTYQNKLIGLMEQDLYEDEIIFTKQTPYQRIVLTTWKDDIRLFLNANLQFSSKDEYRYHEFLVHYPMQLLGEPHSVLILGGGDGLAAREILKYPSVEKIHLVDLDKYLTDLFKQNPLLTRLNKHSLNNNKLLIFNEDAMNFLQKADTVFYDVIIIDLPDPNSVELSKLYSVQFYELVKHRLSHSGIVITQASSPFFTQSTFWSIHKTLQQVFPYTQPARVYVPSFGLWGFVLAGAWNFPKKEIHKLPDNLKYLTPEEIKKCLYFPTDLKQPDTIIINTLSKPYLYKLYDEETRKFY